ncbi:MAG: GcrA family cell cycle regulator, partial [Caulobacteraceae bacterium]
ARPVFKAPRAPRPIAHQPVQQRRSLEPTAPQLPQLPAIPEEPGSATVLTLGAHMCKWPIGDPSSDSFTFCGRRNNEGPYCIEHARVAYQPQQKKNKPSELARSLRRYI